MVRNIIVTIFILYYRYYYYDVHINFFVNTYSVMVVNKDDNSSSVDAVSIENRLRSSLLINYKITCSYVYLLSKLYKLHQNYEYYNNILFIINLPI